MMKGKRRLLLTLIPIAVAVALLVTSIVIYFTRLKSTLKHQVTEQTLELTESCCDAFDIYVDRGFDTVNSIVNNVVEGGYDWNADKATLKKLLSVLNDSDSVYVIINLGSGETVSNVEGKEEMTLSKDRKDAHNELAAKYDHGIRAPYVSQFTDEMMIGFFKCFTFADGVTKGMVRQGHRVSSVAKNFSLSFYDNTGFSYIIGDNGDVYVHSENENCLHDLKNVFDALSAEKKNTPQAVESFRKAIADGEKNTRNFYIGGEEYVISYVPLDSADGWNMLSIIPSKVILNHANSILKNAQIFIIAIVAVALVLGVFLWVVILSQKNVKEKEAEINYREQLFDLLSTRADDVCLMIDANTLEVEYISPNVERILGIAAEEVKRDLRALANAKYLTESDFDYSRFKNIRLGKAVTRETERIHATTGEKRLCVETVYRVESAGSGKFLVVISDRTKERIQKQILENALDTAKAANASKSNFLSNMSHDIRTPMNAIVGLCTLLQRDAEKPDLVREHTHNITASSHHLLGLINDVLDMSKIESGKTTLNFNNINLGEIVNEIETMVRPQIRAKRQTLNITVHNIHDEQLIGDELRINQILVNILSNAVKYTKEEGTINFAVSQLECENKNFAHMRFIVSDNGIGMSEEYMGRLFDPFTREVSSTVSKIQGTGLGMAITKNLVDLMGGTIAVESKLGEGTKFTVDLELRISSESADLNYWKDHNIKRLLIVDDEKQVCENVKETMERAGVEVCCVYSGEESIEMMGNVNGTDSQFDLVLLDWKMPGMDGIAAAREIKKITQDMPILILTACDWSEIEGEARSAGIHGFLPKPFFLTNFRLTLEKIWREERGGTEKKVESIIKGMHFLAAEDNELNSEILKELLDMAGATCDAAENGKIALELFEKSKPGTYDAILMDVQMPVMNGYDATRAIRISEHPDAKKVPIIAMTANAFAEDVKDALDAGMNAHVAKPLDMDVLAATVEKLVKKNP